MRAQITSLEEPVYVLAVQGVRPVDITASLECNREKVAATLERMEKRGVIKRIDRGQYSAVFDEYEVVETRRKSLGHNKARNELRVPPEIEAFVRANYGIMARREMASCLGVHKVALNELIIKLRLGRGA
ncbi:hypothetical protein ACFPVX_17960 [Cohnella faecalis]|uniref:Uncharacterized protein n=1 Tax=Cohnella faecalis TaxID=2315694 RepID=A0A398CDP5_9BACL|nr:hypothetical protein [Cohnella faecalis]RIE01306.1 hypothetical protein D3H35_23265 [Cohnella faecalis]